MREIVRMTAQKEPLEVGVPLFPFSHAGLFRKDDATREAEKDNTVGVLPLPSSPPFDEQQPISPQVVNVVPHPMMVPSNAPAVYDMSVSPPNLLSSPVPASFVAK